VFMAYMLSCLGMWANLFGNDVMAVSPNFAISAAWPDAVCIARRRNEANMWSGFYVSVSEASMDLIESALRHWPWRQSGPYSSRASAKTFNLGRHFRSLLMI
jgi:hypothetical protein